MAIVVSLKLTNAEVEAIEIALAATGCLSRSEFLVTALNDALLSIPLSWQMRAEMRLQRVGIGKRRRRRKLEDSPDPLKDQGVQ